MATHIRNLNWATTPLGPIPEWSDRLKLMVEQVLAYPLVSSLVCGPERVLIYNDAAAKLYGHRHPAVLGGSLSDSFPEGWATVAPYYERAFAGETVQVLEQPIDTRGDGVANDVFDALLMPVREANGQVVYVHMTGSQIGERARAQAALRESEERQRLTMELVPAMLWWANPRGDGMTGNQQWAAYTGQAERGTHNFSWLSAIHPDDLEVTKAAFEHAFATGEPLKRQQRIHKAGDGYRWHLVRHVPVRDASNDITRWFGAAVDIHELHQFQERQSVMVTELQHRTRNLIAVVSALCKQTLRDASSFASFEQTFGNRLSALSRVQGMLSHLSAGKRVMFDELLGSELAALGAPVGKLTLDGPAGVPLRSAAVQTFSLALHELATNSLKYGALVASDGYLTIRWTVSYADADAPRLQVDWRETGVHIVEADQRPRGGGYGRELIERALPYQLNAKTTYEMKEDGVHCTIDVPTSTATAEPE